MVKTTVETVDETTVELTIEVEPKRVQQAFAKAARELAKQVSIPGFRPGKAPRRLLEQRLGEGAIAQAALEDSLTDYYVDALQHEEIDPVGQPKVEVDTFDEAEGCTFRATVEVRPQVEPPDHTGIGVTFPDWDLPADAIDEQLEQLRERFAEVDEVERPATTGDLVTLDLKFEVDGELIDDSSVDDALYEVGSGGVTPKLDEELVGVEAGAELTYDDELPEDFPELGGKLATFHVTVRDVREKTLPELDDDFATSASGLDTIEELRADLHTSLLRRKVVEAQHAARARVVDCYLARVEVPLPEAMVEAEIDQQLQQLDMQGQQYGLDLEGMLAAQGKTLEEYRESAREGARSKVKATLVLDALAQRLQPTVEMAEIEQEILRHAESNRMPPEQIAQIIQQQGHWPMLAGDIVRRKTIDAIVEAAEIDGGPSDEVLIELGLREDPDAVDETDQPAADEPAADEPKLIVPGQSAGEGEGGRLIVPGQDT